MLGKVPVDEGEAMGFHEALSWIKILSFWTVKDIFEFGINCYFDCRMSFLVFTIAHRIRLLEI